MDAKIYHVFVGDENVCLSKDCFVGEYFTARDALELASRYMDDGYHVFVCNIRSGAVYTPLLGRTGEVITAECLNEYYY